MSAVDILDVLVVGAGFSGIHMLWKLRKLGFSVKIYESGSDLGGTWFWNRYPGARVDSEMPVYQLSEPKEIWIDFEWKERFPDRKELLRYFHHVDKKLDLSKDITFNTTVTEATFDDVLNLWLVKMDKGLPVRARHLLLCIGFAAKRHTPTFPGLDTFKGSWYHSAFWPEEGVDLRGKKVAVIGTGASGVQIVQEIGPIVDHLTVYQRTPNIALPMRQRLIQDGDEQNEDESNLTYKYPTKEKHEAMFKHVRETFSSASLIGFTSKKFIETPPEERRQFYESLWQYGSFGFWLATFKEIFFSQEANDEVYQFWCEKTRPRITDPKKQDLLAPLIPPHPLGLKRPSLESTYYEVYNQNNVDLINVNDSPIVEITEHGLKTEKEGVVPVDVLVFATGFDAVTGGILKIKIINGKGMSIQDKWKAGTSTYLGVAKADFPNMFWMYGPHGTTALSNGPTCAEIQGGWICDLLVRMREDGKVRVEALKAAEDEWVTHVHDLWDNSLAPKAKSWYQGDNIPGKVREPLSYFGGNSRYAKDFEKCKMNNFEGFELS